MNDANDEKAKNEGRWKFSCWSEGEINYFHVLLILKTDSLTVRVGNEKIICYVHMNKNCEK